MDYSLDDFLSSSKQDPVIEDKAIDKVSCFDLVAVRDRFNAVLDGSALHGIPDTEIQRLYSLTRLIDRYNLPDMVRDSDKSLDDSTMTDDQALYLFLLDQDFTPAVACRILGINKSMPVIWRKNALFAACLDVVLSALADQAEAITAQEAIYNPKANLERMFYIKAHKPQYRDNAPAPAPAAIQLNVTIDNQPVTVDATLKDVTPD